mgnify:CR=1 FL=1
MSKILKSPAKYVQGRGVLAQLDRYLQGMGKRLMIIISQSGTKRICPTLDKCFNGKDYQLSYHIFCGECSQKQVDEISAEAEAQDCTAIIGIGGGKILDTAKAVSCQTGLPDVIIPTVASSDSPCSSLSILYHEKGEFDRYLHLDRCPDMVLVDTAVIAAAPTRLLVAGMGDAMATWFEARACRASGKNNQIQAKPARAATGLAKMCWENLKRDGFAAKMALDAKVCTEAVETIVETNTYLSSVGFESGGLAAAHGIQKGFTFIPALREQLHGFNVAFCVLAQLVMEDSLEELEEVMTFSHLVGLPICFADLGYEKVDLQEVRNAAEKACVPTSTIHNMPFEVDSDMVYHALIAADAYGREFYARSRTNQAPV